MKDKIYKILADRLIGSYETKMKCTEEILCLIINKQANCCKASVDTDEQCCDICSNCGDRL
jgi:hypothetical protein